MQKDLENKSSYIDPLGIYIIEEWIVLPADIAFHSFQIPVSSFIMQNMFREEILIVSQKTSRSMLFPTGPQETIPMASNLFRLNFYRYRVAAAEKICDRFERRRDQLKGHLWKL